MATALPISAIAATHPDRPTGLHYLGLALQILAFNPWLFARLVLLFGALAVAAAVVAVSDMSAGIGQTAMIFALDAVASGVVPVIVMAAASAGYHGLRLGLRQTAKDGLGSLPRYLWTNLHTSAIFWVPVSLLSAMAAWRGSVFPLEGAAEPAVSAISFASIFAVGLYLHSRTLLAPCLAVHGDLPGTLAALESWRLSGKCGWRVFSTFIAASAPVVVAFAIVLAMSLATLENAPHARMVLLATLPLLPSLAIQFIRPLLYPATYALFEDLWGEERSQRARYGEPATPWLARGLLRLSSWLPRTAGRLIGRRVDWTL